MTKQHNPGDIVGVRVVEDDAGSFVKIDDGELGERVHRTAIVPFPAAMTPEERAVVEAARLWGNTHSQAQSAAADALVLTIIQLEASRAPADPWKELEEAHQAVCLAERRLATNVGNDHYAQLQMNDARARYSAALSAARAAGGTK